MEPPQPLDPLDELLRGRSVEPPWDRWRAAVLARWPWVVAAVVVGGIAAAVLLLRAPGTPAAISLPRATTVPDAVAGATSGPVASVGGTTVVAPTTAIGGAVVVHVAGAVHVPGLVTLSAGGRVADAVAAAGGLRPDADSDRLNLAAPVADGARVYVPIIGRPDPAPPQVVTPADPSTTPSEPSPTSPVDLNTATEGELDALPGVGPSTAAAILAYRTEHGRFASVDELQEVRGIGPAKFEALEALVTVSP